LVFCRYPLPLCRLIEWIVTFQCLQPTPVLLLPSPFLAASLLLLPFSPRLPCNVPSCCDWLMLPPCLVCARPSLLGPRQSAVLIYLPRLSTSHSINCGYALPKTMRYYITIWTPFYFCFYLLLISRVQSCQGIICH